MNTSYFIINKHTNQVKATTSNGAFQLFNEGVVDKKDIDKWPLEKDKWYNIRDSYGYWVLENEFPTFKGNEFISIKYEN